MSKIYLERYELVKHPSIPTMLEVKSVGSGALPQSLRGSFTTEVEAKRAIDRYVATKDVKNAKANSSA